MQPESPIFFLSEDNRVLDVREDVQDAERHLSAEHAGAGDLLYFDGLARPVEARRTGDGVELVVADAHSDPWQVRARALEAIRYRRAWVAAQGEVIALDGEELPKAEVLAQMEPLEGAGLDSSFAAFTQALVEAFTDPAEHSGSFLHNLFHW